MAFAPRARAAEVARASAIVHVSVMTKDDLAAAVFGPDGVAEGAAPGKVLVDHSTTEVEATQAVRRAARGGHRHALGRRPGLGRPARGGGRHARDHGRRRRGGRARRCGRCSKSSGTCTHMGPLGAGQVTKMVNQVIVLANYCVLAEALALAEAGGVDASRIPAALGAGYAGSNMLAAPLSAAGRARLRARRLCLPGAQGPRHGARPRQGAARCRRR